MVIVAVIVALMIAGEILIESFGPTETVRIVERSLSDATGLNVQLGSDFHLEILPVVRFEANDTTVCTLLPTRLRTLSLQNRGGNVAAA